MADGIDRRLAAGTEVGLVLHLGAGACAPLEGYLQSSARNIVLVEPNPALARALEARTAQDARVQVWELAVAAAEGPAELQVFNLEPLSSLRAPDGLTTLFPGLKRVAVVPVTATTPDALVAILPSDGQGMGGAPDVLVIDTPGEEAAVIDGLAAAGALVRFRRIFLHAGTGCDYAGSVPADRLRQRLEEAGYRLEHTDAADPDRPCLEFFLPQAMVEAAARLAELREECAALRAARDGALETVRSSTEAAVREAERGFADRLGALEAELAGTRAAAEAAQTACAVAERAAAEGAQAAAEHAARIAELEAALGEAEAETERRRALEAERDAQRVTAEAAAAAARHAETQAAAHAAAQAAERIAELEAALATAEADTRTTARADTERNTALRAECDALRRAAQEARAEAERTRTETAQTLDGLRDDLALALRQQALRDADLADLRGRHAEVVAQKDRQDVLLQDLTRRLAAAAEFLQGLDASGSGDVAGDLAAVTAPPDPPVPMLVPTRRGKGARKKKKKKTS